MLSFAREGLDLRINLNRKLCFPTLPFSSLRKEAEGNEAVSSKDNVGIQKPSACFSLEKNLDQKQAIYNETEYEIATKMKQQKINAALNKTVTGV